MSSRSSAVSGAVVVWVALALVPAFLVSSGTVGSVDGDGNVSGGAFWSWMLGFVLSFAWVYVIDKAAGRSVHWWFAAASMLPWLVDFSAAFTPRAAVVFTVLTVVFAATMLVTALRAGWIEHGTPAAATVVKVLPNFLHMNFVVNNVYVHRRVLVDVARPDGTHLQRKLGVLSEIGTSPDVGDTLQVVLDPAHPGRVALTTT